MQRYNQVYIEIGYKKAVLMHLPNISCKAKTTNCVVLLFQTVIFIQSTLAPRTNKVYNLLTEVLHFGIINSNEQFNYEANL